MTGTASLLGLRLGALAAVTSVLVFAALAQTASAQAPREYPVTGMVVAVDRAQRTFSASIQEIPGFMAAMTMPFEVRQSTNLDGLEPGVVVAFTLVVDGRSPHAERIRIVQYENTEQDPFNASRLTLLRELAARGTGIAALGVGAQVPNFRLIDQRGKPFTFASLRGKVVALTFVYTECALPNFCLRLANNFASLQQRFANRLGRDLMLLTISFDPVRDTPARLASYSRQWKADPASWRFLTGPPAEVDRVCRLFGVHAFSNEGLLDHSLHTVLVDRQGRLAANIEGNRFTATQLADLTEQLLAQRR